MYRVRTSVDDKEIATDIAKKLVKSHAAVSVHIRKVNSIYAWENVIHNTNEYEVEALCDNPESVCKLIAWEHPYELPEILITDCEASEGIKKWCSDWCTEKK